MIRVDDYVRSEEAFASTKLPKGEASKHFKKSYHSSTRKDDRPLKGHAGRDVRQNDNRNAYGNRDNYTLYRGRDHHATYAPPRGGYQRRVAPILTLDSLIKPPKEILATKPQLRQPPPRSGLITLRAIPLTIHSMMKFPTPKGITTLVTQSVIISECQRLEKKQMLEYKKWIQEQRARKRKRRIIEHTLNVNVLVEHACQKRRVLALERSQVVAKEVAD
ncbi:hypothetical protein Tco_0936961 [Tanacetum coccineum]|uniref:Uncharacterized protein n=1 Tax=Tanacetum coccineum TaxID=301880 RepID=A0ABQ5DFQ4_9ASTR